MYEFTDEEKRQFEQYRERIRHLSNLYESSGMKSPLTETLMEALPFLAEDIKERFKGVPDSLLLFLALMAIHTELDNIHTTLAALKDKFAPLDPGSRGYYDIKHDSSEEISRALRWNIHGFLEQIATNSGVISQKIGDLVDSMRRLP